MKPSKIMPVSKEQPEFIARGEAAAHLIAKELRAEHKRWNLPLLFGKTARSWPPSL